MTASRKAAFAAVVAAVAAAVVTIAVLATRPDSAPHRASTAAPDRSPAATADVAPDPVAQRPLSEQPAPGPLPRPAAGTRPVRVVIPAISVNSSLESLAVTRTGELAAPSQWQRAGWYADGVRPGMVGPAVIAGHVDSTSGPAVFYDLDNLRRGNRVYVTRADGTRLTFVVDGSQQYRKRTFPTDAVYGPTSQPVLRLITCAGDFDADKHSYVDNLVVTTHLVTT